MEERGVEEGVHVPHVGFSSEKIEVLEEPSPQRSASPDLDHRPIPSKGHLDLVSDCGLKAGPARLWPKPRHRRPAADQPTEPCCPYGSRSQGRYQDLDRSPVHSSTAPHDLDDGADPERPEHLIPSLAGDDRAAAGRGEERSMGVDQGWPEQSVAPQTVLGDGPEHFELVVEVLADPVGNAEVTDDP
jgi:hypothetical protein